tara:strand:- start:56 stop:805 length:750 start_codon:yes stop_codon:yes gene_type:complete
MSIKTTVQLIIVLLIGFILSLVYYNYFSVKNDIDQNIKDFTEEKVIEEKVIEKKVIKEKVIEEKNLDTNKSNKDLNISEKSNLEEENIKSDISEVNDKNNQEDGEDLSNILKEVEYLTIDNKGNKYKIYANSGVTSDENKDILELDKVRGIITSEKRSTIYIVSDFAKYNSSNQNSHFYQNVVINFEDKQIDCDYFDINMQTNLSVAYGNVVVTDPKSIMKAGKITLDMETKDINIEPESKKKVKIETE